MTKLPVAMLLLAAVILCGTMGCTARPPAGKPAGPLAQSQVAPQDLPEVSAGPQQRVAPMLPGGFRRVAEGNIRGFALARLGDLSLAECAGACSNAKKFACRSFDYYERQRICELSNRSAAETGGWRDDYGLVLDHYEQTLFAPSR